MNNIKPILSYVVLTRNRINTLRKTLCKILEQSKGFSSEILVIDNASEDNTCEMIEKEFPEIRFFRNKLNLGAEARNIGINKSRAKYICMLDDDSYPLNNSIVKGINILEKNPKAGCLAYKIEMPGKKFWTNALYNSYAGCGALFRKNALLKVGGYPQDYGYYVEEYDVSFRLIAAGFKILNKKDLVVFHEQASSGRDLNRIISLLVKNNIRLYSKFFPSELAMKQIRHEIMRYGIIAEKEKTVEGYIKGLESSFSSFDLTGKNILPLKVCYKILGLDETNKRLADFIRKYSVKKTLIYNIGKITHLIIEKIRSLGCEVVAVVDKNAKFYDTGFSQEKVISFSEIGKESFDSIICGSSSLIENDVIQESLKKNPKFKKVPFLRLCDYDRSNYG